MLSLGGWHPHCPGFLWPWSLARQLSRRKRRPWVGWLPTSQGVSLAGGGAEPDHPTRKCLGATREETEDPAHQSKPEVREPELRGPWYLLTQCQPSQGQRGDKCKKGTLGQGQEVWAGYLQGALHTQSWTCASALQGHTLQAPDCTVFLPDSIALNPSETGKSKKLSAPHCACLHLLDSYHGFLTA